MIKTGHWRKAVAIMALAVAVLTISALVLPAITMGRETYCEIDEHEHTAGCYEKQLVCGKEESGEKVLSCAFEGHKHQENCYNSDGEVICGYADYVVHEHTDNCYGADGTLVCSLPEVKEHKHDTSCYTEQKELVCTTAETEGHTHTEACYTMTATGNTICTASEEEGHVHTDECYEKVKTLTCGQQEAQGHRHTDNCYRTVRTYTCDKPEVILHKHDDAKCYSTDAGGNRYLSCDKLEVLSHEHDDNCFRDAQGEGEKHTHTDACYKDVPVCGKEEHRHEDSCFDKEAAKTADTEQKAETADADQTTWATQENEAEETPVEPECGKEEHTHTEECYSNNGQMVCELEEHTHELSCYPKDAQEMMKEMSLQQAGTQESADPTSLAPYRQSIEIRDKDGKIINPGGTLYVGESYEISIGFAESEGKQFNTTLTTWTYQLPSSLIVAEAQSQTMTIRITENGQATDYEVPYDVSKDGLITIYPTDEVKSRINDSADVSFNVHLDAQVADDGTGSTEDIVFEGFGEGFIFHTSIRPTISVAKTGASTDHKDDNGNSTGGVLTYTIKGNVMNGPVKGLTFVDKAGYTQEYFGDADAVQGNLAIGPVVITCKDGTSGHGRTLEGNEYSLIWGKGTAGNSDKNTGDGFSKNTFILKVNEDIQIDDCDTIEVTYSVPYTAKAGVNYYQFDVENTVTFSGKAVQPATGPAKDNPEDDVVTNLVNVKGGTTGIKGIIKEIDDTDYDKDKGGLLHYKITVDLEALNYSHFYLADELTVVEGDDVYRVGAEPKNMQVTITGESGQSHTLTNLTERDPDWIHNMWAPEYIMPEKNYYAYFGRNHADWIAPGVFNLPFNPIGVGSWERHTSLNLTEDSEIVVTYDINVDEKIGLYLYETDRVTKVGDDITLREYLDANVDAPAAANVDVAILRNTVQMKAGGQWGGSTVDYNRGDRLRKRGVENEDGTIDYTVTLLVDKAVRERLRKSEEIAYDDPGSDWSVTGVDVDFYDEFPEGWEYVEGSLTAAPSFGSWSQTFYYADYFGETEVEKNKDLLNPVTGNRISPVTEGGHAIDVSWNGFVEDNSGNMNIGWNLGSSILWSSGNSSVMNLDALTSVTFKYTLRPTEKVGEGLPKGDKVKVPNHAEVRFNSGDPYKADHELLYNPKFLSKTAKQNTPGSNVISFEIDVNPAGVDLNPNGTKINLTDTMGANLRLNPKTALSVKDRYGNDIPSGIPSGWGMETKEVKDANGNTCQQIILSNLPDNQHLKICYEALVSQQGDNIEVSNTASITGVAETSLDEHTTFNISSTSGGGQGTIDYFTIYKKDKDNETIKLEGAEFNIYKATPDPNGSYTFKKENNNETKYSAQLIKSVTTDANGEAKVKDPWVTVGNYYILEETIVPQGYIKPKEKYLLVYFAGAPGIPADVDVDENAEIIDFTCAYTVRNEAYKVELPETGGTGTLPYTMAGIALVAVAAMLYRNENSKTKIRKE